ncbi:MAG: selenocysteine-specific translation elongation factor [Gemmatimonadetes bacterium]|nr:selenocysteine-specific translation elongation factor [Gemmatimonadota bacterium]
MILGTAGHIDHGKTTLVRALTGVDTDRLPEEKRRGITIELGFAPLHLEGVGTVGVIDVPGHEAFVRTMVAGATGIDLALLVIAADEGVMPQTREHLAILQLLGVGGGVVAITKSDLVEPDWLALVTDDVREALVAGPLADAAVIAVSATTGEGLDALRLAIADAAAALPARASGDLFRMPIDRAFTVRGTGTVVTGTVWSGTLVRDSALRLFPSGDVVRVRGLQAHGHSVERIHAGQRAAIALAGVDLDRVGRGAVLVDGEAWRPSTVLRADVALLPDAARSLGPRTRVRLHLGTSEVGARVVVHGPSLAPGERRAARIAVDEPIVARAGDRFVLRGGSPVATIGGGVVTDPFAPSRSRGWQLLGAAPRESLELLLRDAGNAGLAIADLPQRLGLSPERASAMLLESSAWCVDDRVYAVDLGDVIAAQLLELVTAFHRDRPLDGAAPRQWLRSRIRAPQRVVDEVIDRLVRTETLVAEAAGVRRRDFAAVMSQRQLAIAEAVVARLTASGSEPPALDELTAELRVAPDELRSICRALAREGKLVAVEPNRYYLTSAVTALRTGLLCGMSPNVDYGPAELRDLIGLTRKFLIPFLEYCDHEGYTIRDGLGRRRRGM